MFTRFSSLLVTSVLAAALLSGCGSQCVFFEDLAAGTQLPFGSTATSNGVTLNIETFQWGTGPATSGYAAADTANHALGQGQAMRSNNANIRFAFHYPVKRITLKFGDLGGFNNLDINGDARRPANFSDLNGATVGGAQITVAASGSPNQRGTLTAVGNITGFSIGGQELWIDNVCAKK